MRDESIECFNMMRTKGGVCGRLSVEARLTRKGDDGAWRVVDLLWSFVFCGCFSL